MEALAQDLRDDPDACQSERAARSGVCQNAIHQALKKLRVSDKRTLCPPRVDAAARRSFQAIIEDRKKQGRAMISIDKRGFGHGMPRRHGYAPIGQRCHGVQEGHPRGRTNAIGALIGISLPTVGLFQCTVNADVFTAWVKPDLLPRQPEKAVIVMENAAFHKRGDTRELITNAGHELVYLPPYSPDLNPTEQKWAQAKAMRRRLLCAIEKIFKNKSILFF